MTIELTPAQLQDLRDSVTRRVETNRRAAEALWDAPQPIKNELSAETLRIQSLLGLLTNSTAVLLYRP